MADYHQPVRILGIDIGTTTVKVCLIDGRMKRKIAEQSKCTNAQIYSDVADVEAHDEQCPGKIVLALQNCLLALKKDDLNKVTHIGICGQMHGVILWNPTCWTYNEKDRQYVLNKEHITNLITWQDRRCSEKFLMQLPGCSSTQFVKPASGYGCATMFWLLKHGFNFDGFTCGGTIQDFIVSMITNRHRCIMTPQNGASFGYFNPEMNQWDSEALQEANFPCHILLETGPEDRPAGLLKHSWCGVSKHAVVFPAMGDTQCAVFSGLRHEEKTALLHIGTSAQLSFVLNKRYEPIKDYSSVFPYFDGTYLRVAASLNGGNVLSHFVSTLKSWVSEFGRSPSEVEIWTRLLNPRENNETMGLDCVFRVRPLLFGERHEPHAKGTITDISPKTISLDGMFQAVCAGLIQNLIEMLPLTTLRNHNIDKVRCAGKVFSQNGVMTNEVKRVFNGFSVEFSDQFDSAFGAALAVAMFLEKS